MTLRKLTAFAQLAGGSLPILEARVHQIRTKHGDTFEAKLDMSAPGVNVAEFASGTASQLECQIIVNGSQLCDGLVDHVDCHFDKLEIDISGRDKCAKLIDAHSSEKWLNKQPSQIVQDIAGRHGLSANVDTGGDLAGRIFKDTWDSISHRSSEWSVIQWLADHFGMNAYMTGGQVYFKDQVESLPNYNLQWRYPTPGSYAVGTFLQLTTTRNIVLGRPVTTNVRSRNHKQKKTYTGTKTKGGSGDPLVYNYVIPQATQEQANRIASKKHRENTRHEFALRATCVGDASLNARFYVTLSGTNSAFDRQYEVDSIEHEISFEHGYTMTIDAKSGNSQ